MVPWPSPALSAKTLPPCARAIERTMKRPSPVPFTWDRERPRHAVEALEYALEFVRGNPHAAIADAQNDALVVGGFDLNRHIHVVRPNT